MTSPSRQITARQPAGEPSPAPGRRANRTRQPGSRDISEVDRQIAQLLDQTTQELRLAWRRLYRTGPPAGLSRDLLIRALAHQLQEQTQGRAGAALRRRLRSLATEFEKGSASFASGAVPKAGATLVRQWRGHTHTVLVGENSFEYEGQRYRSLTVIAEQITGTHWSGPRFFGVTKRARGSLPAEANR
jgi:hypothetical protein